MKTFAKLAAGAVLLGAGIAAASPADAQVSFSVQFSSPGYGRQYAPPPPPRTYCDPRNRYFRACEDYWYEPVFYRGVWYTQPVQTRIYAGTRLFWIDNDWRRDEWRGPPPNWNRGYGNQSGYGNQPGYGNRSGYGNQPGYGNRPGYGPRR